MLFTMKCQLYKGMKHFPPVYQVKEKIEKLQKKIANAQKIFMIINI
jgi:hypothetical protein